MIDVEKYRLFDPTKPPEWLDSEWWKNTDNCNHLDNRVHQARLRAAADTAMRAAVHYGVDKITDLGAGDGGLLSLLTGHFKEASWGYEIITDSVRYAKEVRHVDVQEANVLKDDILLAPVVVATEMLEHLEDPYAFVTALYNRPHVAHFIASSPHSETQEHHEWNHAWAWDRAGYREMFEAAGWTVREHFDAEWSQVLWAEK